MAGRKKKTTSVLGDDPLSWLGKDEAGGEQKDHGKTQLDSQIDSTNPDQNIPVAASQTNAGQEPVYITLDPVITLSEVSQLRELLLGHVSIREIQIDVSKVEHIDTAGLQLLLAFSKTIQKRGRKISWTGWSAAYSGTAELLGLTRAAGLEENQ